MQMLRCGTLIRQRRKEKMTNNTANFCLFLRVVNKILKASMKKLRAKNLFNFRVTIDFIKNVL